MLHNQLTCHHQCIVVSSTVKNGSVVLVKENSVPTLSWPPGVAKGVFPGKGGVVRSVNVKTIEGVICKFVQIV